MTDHTLPDFEFGSEAEAVDALDKRIENKKMHDGLLETIDQTADTLIDEYSFDVDVDRDSLFRYLTIGYAEWICRFIDADVRPSKDIPQLIDDIEDNPIDNSQIVLGRMTDRSRACMMVSKAVNQRRSSKMR